MTTPDQPSPNTSPEGNPSRVRIRFGLLLTLFGLFVFLIGARPALFGLDRAPVIGFIQIAVLLVGLAIICLGGYIGLLSFWRNGNRTIAADIGSRLVATGYVVAAFSGMADYFGLGTRVPPLVPFFGPWQATGVQIGEMLITIGFLLMIPIHRRKETKEE
jgi:hypothetical protein